jgi:hypothetical protein
LLAVTVEITHGHSVRSDSGIELAGGTKTAVTVAQQDRRSVVIAGGDEVLLAIAVEIAHRHGARSGDVEVCGSTKTACAVPQQDRHAAIVVTGASAKVSNRQV